MTSTTLREMLVKQEPRYVNYCYVCSGLRAEYTVFAKPFGDHPFFPFLEHHQPPEGTESMSPDGRVLVCLICYTFLNQQWDSYEKNKTPQNKRIYWLKRLDNGPFAGMDLNLQQDYEALFEASNAGGEPEARQKTKQSRIHHTGNLEVIKPTAKFHEKPESLDSNSFHFQREKAESQSNNILDLSMPSRTPSQCSTSASPSSSSEVCYVCGLDSKSVINIFAKPISNCPFFPSLMLHAKPSNAKAMDSNGKVHACDLCHKSLIQQWDFYQRQNVPHNDRAYQLKSQPLISVKSDIPSKDQTFVCFICGMVTQLSIQRYIHAYPENEGDPYFSFLQNLIPHPGASRLVDGKAAVCSLCYKSLSRQRRVYELSSIPEESRKYKVLNESTAENFSVLRQHLKSGAQSQTAESKSDCYLCEHSTNSLFFINTIPTGDMYFPFIRNLTRPMHADLIDNQGRVKVCNQCHNSLRYQWDAFEHAHIPINQRQYKVSSPKIEHSERYVPSSTQQCDSSAMTIEEEYIARKVKDICSLCERVLTPDNVRVLDTQPQKESMYFPSIALLVKPSSGKCIDQYGRVLACHQCYLILKKQWDVFESAHVPHSQRQYEIFSPLEKEQIPHFANSLHLSEASSALHIQVSSPELKFDLSKHSTNAEPLLTTVNTLPVSNLTTSSAHIVSSANSPLTIDHKTPPSKSNPDELAAPKICGPLDVPYVRPLLLMPITCFICGEYNSSGLTYAIKSIPKLSEDVPFFPFLSKHPTPDGAEKLANDGSALACMFCYHSMVSQWLAYESSPFPEDSNRWHRHYNTHNYVCFICGITTYRKRVCSISVRDFPFLMEHLRPPGALTLLNGECVVTCLMCFESVTSQWKDFERMKVPVEMRKYNWIVMPPPPDDENSRGCQILSVQESSAASVSNLLPNEGEQGHLEDSGLPHSLKPAPSHMPVPAPYGLVKPVNRSLMSPAHQAQGSQPHGGMGFSPFGSSGNPAALNATRTSSFAAALRKLAKQAIEPVPDKELSPISPASSPALSQQSSHSRHHASLPMYLNSRHSNASPMSHPSPPIVTVAPMQNNSMQGKGLDISRYSSSGRSGVGSAMEPVSLKVENTKPVNSCGDKRTDPGPGNKQFAPSSLQMSLRHEHSASSRGFQPYRNIDDHHTGPPQMYNSSPPQQPPPSAERYAYQHPSYSQSSHAPPHPYRLEDSVYLERYGLLRPSAMPYPQSSSNILPHPRAPLYPSSHYPPELITQSMRSVTSNNGAFAQARFTPEEESISDGNIIRKRELDLYRERERYLDSEEGSREMEEKRREMEYLRQERNNLTQSPMPRSYSSNRNENTSDDKGRMGSITQGTPRDLVVRRLSPPLSSVPLNLATSVNHSENERLQKEEYDHPRSRHHYNATNGLHMHVNPNFRRESSPNFQIMRQTNQENDQKQSHDTSISDTLSSSKLAPYYSERDFQKTSVVETRTLTMSSVINSQINGIFSREKYSKPSSYEFPTNFSTNIEKNTSPEGQSKVKSEFKSTYSSPENYTHSIIPRERISIQENMKFDPTSNRQSAFTPSDHQLTLSGESLNPLSYKARAPSLTRALLQSNITPSVLDSYVQLNTEQPPKVVSKLDAREAKVRKTRLKGNSEESEESEPDSEEESCIKIKRLLTITKGPAQKFYPEPKKMKFLSNVALVTHSRKQTLELKKCIRRHRVLREKSCSPVVEEQVKEVELVVHYDQEHISELSKRLCLQEDFSLRKEFLYMLHLEPLTAEQKFERDKTLKVIDDEKARRNGQLKPSQRCLELQGFPIRKRGYSILHGLKHNTAKKPNLNDCEINSDSETLQGQKLTSKRNVSFMKITRSDITPARRISAFLKPPTKTTTLPVPALIPSSQATSSLPDTSIEKSSSVVAIHDPRVRKLNKEFAQEFHNSVLQTTQMQLAVKKGVPNKPTTDIPTDQLSSSASSPDDKMEWTSEVYKSAFRWPGIEAIMESYECHISEQSTEKKFLTGSCQNLKAVIHQSNIQIECLGQKTKELMQEKHQLDLERRKLQSSVDNFKTFIQHFR